MAEKQRTPFELPSDEALKRLLKKTNCRSDEWAISKLRLSFEVISHCYEAPVREIKLKDIELIRKTVKKLLEQTRQNGFSLDPETQTELKSLGASDIANFELDEKWASYKESGTFADDPRTSTIGTPKNSSAWACFCEFYEEWQTLNQKPVRHHKKKSNAKPDHRPVQIHSKPLNCDGRYVRHTDLIRECMKIVKLPISDSTIVAWAKRFDQLNPPVRVVYKKITRNYQLRHNFRQSGAAEYCNFPMTPKLGSVDGKN